MPCAVDCLSPPHPYVETWIPNEMISGGGPFGRYLGHEGGTLTNRIDTLKKETQGTSWPLYPHHSVMSISLWPHGLEHARPPCPSPTPRIYSNSCRWCHPTISSSVDPLSCLQSLPKSGSFPMRQFFTLDSQSIGVSALAYVLPTNIQDWFPLGWTNWVSLQSKGLSRVFSNTTVQKHQLSTKGHRNNCLWTRKWTITRHGTCWYTDPGLDSSQNCEKWISVVCKPLQPWYSVTAARTDEDTSLFS